MANSNKPKTTINTSPDSDITFLKNIITGSDNNTININIIKSFLYSDIFM